MKLTMMAALASMVVGLTGCGGAMEPAAFDPATEPCRFCRMTGSDGRTAAQLAAPGDEPVFFDDIGCLLGYLRQTASVPRGAAAYVADHRTRGWVRADEAIYTRHERLKTPMSSHVMAHATAASRNGDAEADGGSAISFAELFKDTPLGERR